MFLRHHPSEKGAPYKSRIVYDNEWKSKNEEELIGKNYQKITMQPLTRHLKTKLEGLEELGTRTVLKYITIV